MIDDENIISIDFDDDEIDYLTVDKFLQDDTKRKKNQAISEIEVMGKQYLKEIDRKKIQKELKKKKLIPYIIKKSKGKYDIENLDELNSYSFEDVQDIYNEVKIENRSTISNFFHFLFNIE